MNITTEMRDTIQAELVANKERERTAWLEYQAAEAAYNVKKEACEAQIKEIEASCGKAAMDAASKHWFELTRQSEALAMMLKQ